MLWFIIVLLVVGFIAGGLARLLVPGPDPMSLAGTWLLGVLGSFLGGFLGYVLFGADVEDGVVHSLRRHRLGDRSGPPACCCIAPDPAAASAPARSGHRRYDVACSPGASNLTVSGVDDPGGPARRRLAGPVQVGVGDHLVG